MSNPYRAPEAEIHDPVVLRRSLKGMLFVPLGIGWICVLFFWMSLYFDEVRSIFEYPKFWLVCCFSSTMACAALVALRVRSFWFLCLLAPLLSLAVFAAWVTVENLALGGMTW